MRVFITGITGSLGREVLSQLLDAGDEVVGYSRDEFKQKQIPHHPNLILYLGDVRDGRRLLEATRNVDLIYHFAALKHVDLMETNPEECIATNIHGTQNVLHAQRVNHVPRVVLSSTDKAAYPINIYGASKLSAEKLVTPNKNNVVCRYGNVFASRGSVISHFVNTLRKERVAYVTHPKMTRFFIRIEDAANFVIKSSNDLEGGLKIPRMKACYITDLVSGIADLLEIDDYEIKYVGIRPGEKIHETLRTEEEGEWITSQTAPHFTEKELKKLIKPIVTGGL